MVFLMNLISFPPNPDCKKKMNKKETKSDISTTLKGNTRITYNYPRLKVQAIITSCRTQDLFKFPLCIIQQIKLFSQHV